MSGVTFKTGQTLPSTIIPPVTYTQPDTALLNLKHLVNTGNIAFCGEQWHIVIADVQEAKLNPRQIVCPHLLRIIRTEKATDRGGGFAFILTTSQNYVSDCKDSGIITPKWHPWGTSNLD